MRYYHCHQTIPRSARLEERVPPFFFQPNHSLSAQGFHGSTTFHLRAYVEDCDKARSFFNWNEIGMNFPAGFWWNFTTSLKGGATRGIEFSSDKYISHQLDEDSRTISIPKCSQAVKLIACFQIYNFSRIITLTGDRIWYPRLAENGFQNLSLEDAQSLPNLWSQHKRRQDDNVNDNLQSLQAPIPFSERVVPEACFNWSFE